MPKKLTLLSFSLLAIFSWPPTAAAYTDRNIEPVRTRGGVFNIEAIYERSQAMVENSVNLRVKITTQSAKQSFLKITALPEVDDPSAAAARFKFTLLTSNLTPAPTDDGGALGVEYLYDVSIPADADPHGHKVKLQLNYEDEDSTRYFALNVGSKTGKLELVKAAEGSEAQTCEAGFFARVQCTYKLSLKNNFNDYTVTIEALALDSMPPGLIESSKEPDEQNPNLLIGPGDVQEITRTFIVEPLTLRNMVKGLATAPRLKITARYNDGNHRPPITGFEAYAPVSIAPRTQVLFGAVLVGLLIGAIARYVLEFMVWKKQITRGELMRFITYTVVFGLLVALLAFIGKIEIKGFTVSGSYDNPLAMLFIGLVGALAGLQLFLGWYKAVRGEDSKSGAAK